MKLSRKAASIIRKSGSSAFAYVYRDGIVVCHRVDATVKKHRVPISVTEVYILRGEVPIYEENGREGQRFGRLVLHNATILLDGFESFRIYWNNCSTKTAEMGITCHTVEMWTPSGARHVIHDMSVMSSDISVQSKNQFQSMAESECSVEAWLAGPREGAVMRVEYGSVDILVEEGVL